VYHAAGIDIGEGAGGVEEEHRHDGYDHTTYCTMRKRL